MSRPEIPGPTTTVEEYAAAASGVCAPLHVVAEPDAPFDSRYRGNQVGPIHVAHILSSSCTVSRSRRHIDLSDGDAGRDKIKVLLQLRGRTGVAQGDQTAVLRPGEMICYETATPYELRVWEPSETVVVGVQRASLGARNALLARRRGIPAVSDARLSAAVTRLVDDLLDLPPGPSDRHLADALVMLAFSPFPDVPADGAEELADRLLAYCVTNLHDPGLSVASVARAHHISPRYLHKVLEPREVTLSAWIRHSRLDRIRRDLADPACAGRTVAAIAGRWGLPDTAHLSRALRAEFGQTASELRAAAPGGVKPTGTTSVPDRIRLRASSRP